VDRRLVSNVLISFLVTPRSDSKRFQMLQVLSSILGWTEDQKEQVGLQKSSGGLAPPTVTPRKSGSFSKTGGLESSKDDELENESFSNLFVEFLLREANQGQGVSPPHQPTSLKSTSKSATSSPMGPLSPTSISSPLSPTHFEKFRLPEIPPFDPEKVLRSKELRANELQNGLSNGVNGTNGKS